MNQSEYGVAATLHSPIAVEDENVSASLGFSSNEQWITFDVQNKSDSVIQLIVDVSSYAGPTSNSKLIPEGTH
jgi:hypothetical protein